MRVLLTGAAGRLGSQVCRHLVGVGHEVVAVDSSYRKGLPARLHVVDLLDRNAVYPLVEGCEAVVHLANHPDLGRISPAQRLYAENVAMNANVFQAAVETGARTLVFASSVQALSGERDCYGGTGDRPSGLPCLPLDEHVPARPGNLYALSKANTEEMLRHYVLLDPARSCTAIRFPWIWTGEWIPRYRRGAGSGPGRLDEGFGYLAVQDAAELVGCVLRANRPGYIHFVPAAPNNVLGWTALEVADRFYPDVPLKVPRGQLASLMDLAALERHYGWIPKTLVDFPRWQEG